ncbi:hypothetical protein DFA_11933 [Cavenderia fasciculata]|uniref:Uncharacterized protein n=1 Tax=Cavenderia fasciculata TaxID=261658 RepID=F4QEV7_CACFS|nr:uncharacterized protein DFA_11933 [Cavenderia fasciculata]EGG14164.1 hypothetical protein DFA_11933 [Cavenderia fasciculata]|eukprot:XP_004350872.1 hypothetical protein DFA_11933 [Cavenderia fasciculata]
MPLRDIKSMSTVGGNPIGYTIKDLYTWQLEEWRSITCCILYSWYSELFDFLGPGSVKDWQFSHSCTNASSSCIIDLIKY